MTDSAGARAGLVSLHGKFAEPTGFRDPEHAVDRLCVLYDQSTAHLRTSFADLLEGREPAGRVRATYPEIRFETSSFAQIDSRLSYGHVAAPGNYATTITRPDLFRNYLIQQLDLLVRNHDRPVIVGPSMAEIPLHFAFADDMHVEARIADAVTTPLRDIFDVPDLQVMDDAIVNGTHAPAAGEPLPLAAVSAPRSDYSLHRLAHYTAPGPEHFQNFVLFTNYQFYVDAFCELAAKMMSDGDSPYSAIVEPGNVITESGASEPSGERPSGHLPQMPAYHLTRPDSSGLTLVSIGVGPSNAKTITDHIAVLRPHAWLMLGHCAGLRNTQQLGDYVLAHGYVREDHVLDADLPGWVPIPPLAEVQVALEEAVAEVTGLTGFELKRVMRTGTVATIDNRNWELRDHREPVQRLSQSRALALDMASATIAANGFRVRVPYGTLLCVSD